MRIFPPLRTSLVGELLATPVNNVGADAHIRPRGAEGSAPYIPASTILVGCGALDAPHKKVISNSEK